MIISKKWSMPNSETFSIKPIKELIDRYKKDGMVIVDPFARNSDIGTITNDLDPDTKAMYHKDATDFLRGLKDNMADMVLYDPPYSARQVSESYKRLGESVNMQTTQSSYWARQKKEIARITKKGGVVITCAWNSGGIGAGLGFEQQEILLVAHGGWHNDTIVTVERKMMDGMHDNIPILMEIKKLDDMSLKKAKIMKERIFTTKEQGRALVKAGLPISTASGYRSSEIDRLYGINKLYSMEDNAGRVSLTEAVTPDVSNPVWDVGTLMNLLPYEIEGSTLECYKLEDAWSVTYRDIDEIPIYWSSERLLIDTLFSLMTTLLKNGLYEYKTNSKNKVQNGG